MILITGGAGFIGGNLIKKINKNGDKNIIIVDNLKKNKKNLNLLKFEDFFDKNEFYKKILKK